MPVPVVREFAAKLRALAVVTSVVLVEVRVAPLPVNPAVHANAPVALVRVQPVEAEPPPKRMLPVEVLFKFKIPEDLKCSLNFI